MSASFGVFGRSAQGPFARVFWQSVLTGGLFWRMLLLTAVWDGHEQVSFDLVSSFCACVEMQFISMCCVDVDVEARADLPADRCSVQLPLGWSITQH